MKEPNEMVFAYGMPLPDKNIEDVFKFDPVIDDLETKNEQGEYLKKERTIKIKIKRGENLVEIEVMSPISKEDADFLDTICQFLKEI